MAKSKSGVIIMAYENEKAWQLYDNGGSSVAKAAETIKERKSMAACDV